MRHRAPVVNNPREGQPDHVASRLISAGIQRIPNPLVRACMEELHEELKPDLATDLTEMIGPDTAVGQAAEVFIRRANGVVRRLRERSGQ